MADIVLTSDPITNGAILQAAIDSAEAVLTLPEGLVHFEATPTRRFLRLDKDLILRTNSRTVFKLGPDTFGGSGFDHSTLEWDLFKAVLGNYRIEMMPGIVFEGPDIDPDQMVDATPKSVPFCFKVQGTGLGPAPTVRREIVFHHLEARGGFHDVLALEGDLEPSPPGFTECWVKGGDISCFGNGISAFGRNKRLRIENLRMVAGWHQAGDWEDQPGFGNCLYVHQGVDLQLDGFDITTRYGRDCIKYAGTNADRRGTSAYISNGVCRSGRVGWGAGIGTDKFIDCPISNVFFENTLWQAIQNFGRVTMIGGVVECPNFIGAAGSGVDDDLVVAVTGTKFAGGIRSIVISGLANAAYHFTGCTANVENGTYLFGLNGPAAATSRIRIHGGRYRMDSGQAIFDMERGNWDVASVDLMAGEEVAWGIFGRGALPGVEATVRGGTLSGPMYYHAAAQADKDRIVFME